MFDHRQPYQAEVAFLTLWLRLAVRKVYICIDELLISQRLCVCASSV